MRGMRCRPNAAAGSGIGRLTSKTTLVGHVLNSTLAIQAAVQSASARRSTRARGTSTLSSFAGEVQKSVCPQSCRRTRAKASRKVGKDLCVIPGGLPHVVCADDLREGEERHE